MVPKYCLEGLHFVLDVLRVTHNPIKSPPSYPTSTNGNIYVNTILMFTLTLTCINGNRFLTVYAEFPIFALYKINREYFIESAGVRYLRTSCWRIRNRTSERSEQVRFLIQKQRVRKYRTKHFPCGIVFILYVLRHSSFWRPFHFKYFRQKC